MAKFIIIDPSIKRAGGHYLEYAERALGAARVAGYETLIVAHREFGPSMTSGGHPVKARFHRDFFENSSTLAGLFKQAARPLLIKIRDRALRPLARPLARLLAGSSSIAFATRLFWGSWPGEVLGPPSRLLLQRLQRAGKIISRSRPARLASQAFAALVPDLPLALAVLAAALLAPGLFLALAALALAVLAFWLIDKWRRPYFQADLAALFREGLFAPGDLVFIPTVGFAELAGLFRVLRKKNLASQLRWRLLCRRDLAEGRRPHDLDPHRLEAVLRAWRRRLARLRPFALSADLAFFTDTRELSFDYDLLGVFNFGVAPVLTEPGLKAKAPARPLAVLYMGDARDEKGFDALPGLITETKDLAEAGEIAYVVQSNFNVPGGERDSARAMHTLRELQAAGLVRLTPGPLDSAKYKALLASAGLVVIPYRRENYLARSSGVFAEAVAAGLPCLIPAGTAMARQAEPARQVFFREAAGDSAFTVLARARAGLSELRSGYGFKAPLRRPSPPRGTAPRGAHYYLLATWPGFLKRDAFLRLEAWNLSSGASQTVAAGAGEPGLALLRLDEPACRITLKISPDFEPAGEDISFELSLLSRPEPLPAGAGSGIFESRADLAPALRDMVRHYEHYRAGQARAAAALRPDFDPGRLLELFAPPARPRAPRVSEPLKIMGLSDVSLGYGSPQIPSLVESLRRHYPGSRALILETDESHRPPKRPDFLGDEVETARLFVPRLLAWPDAAGYAARALPFLRAFKPDLLVTAYPGALYFLPGSDLPPDIILQYLEYGAGSLRGWLLRSGVRSAAPKIKWAVFPEKFRARLEGPFLGLQGAKTVIMHNSRLFKNPPTPRAPESRNGRFVYAGGLYSRVNYRWLLDERAGRFDIDVFTSHDHKDALKNSPAVNYRGYLPSDDGFFRLLSNYAFALVLWSPDYEDTFYCAPNKLYDALSCGVPFISGPHPLCLDLVRKYNCGLITADFSLESFLETLGRARALFGTPAYGRLVQGTLEAMKKECAWETQFKKLAAFLPAAESLLAKRRPEESHARIKT